MELITLLGQSLVFLVVVVGATLLTMALLCFALSFPGWLVGTISASNSPQLKTVRRGPLHWIIWFVLGDAPLTLAIALGPLSGTGQVIPGPAAVFLGIFGVIVLNVSAFFIGYKHGLNIKVKRAIQKDLKSGNMFSSDPQGEGDVLNENHPAIASTPGAPPMATTPPPAASAHSSPSESAPTREFPAHDAAPLDDEYPIARPHGE